MHGFRNLEIRHANVVCKTRGFGVLIPGPTLNLKPTLSAFVCVCARRISMWTTSETEKKDYEMTYLLKMLLKRSGTSETSQQDWCDSVHDTYMNLECDIINFLNTKMWKLLNLIDLCDGIFNYYHAGWQKLRTIQLNILTSNIVRCNLWCNLNDIIF